jgi:hypothetical protein
MRDGGRENGGQSLQGTRPQSDARTRRGVSPAAARCGTVPVFPGRGQSGSPSRSLSANGVMTACSMLMNGSSGSSCWGAHVSSLASALSRSGHPCRVSWAAPGTFLCLVFPQPPLELGLYSSGPTNTVRSAQFPICPHESGLRNPLTSLFSIHYSSFSYLPYPVP